MFCLSGKISNLSLAALASRSILQGLGLRFPRKDLTLYFKI